MCDDMGNGMWVQACVFVCVRVRVNANLSGPFDSRWTVKRFVSTATSPSTHQGQSSDLPPSPSSLSSVRSRPSSRLLKVKSLIRSPERSSSSAAQASQLLTCSPAAGGQKSQVLLKGERSRTKDQGQITFLRSG